MGFPVDLLIQPVESPFNHSGAFCRGNNAAWMGMNASKAIDMLLHRSFALLESCGNGIRIRSMRGRGVVVGGKKKMLPATRRASKSCKKKFQTNTVKDRMLNYIHQTRAIFFSDISDNCAKHRTGIRSEIVLRIIPQESLQIGGGIDGFVEDCNTMVKPG